MFAISIGTLIVDGLRSAASMLWMTWWPLVLGFGLSGCVQSFVRHDGLRSSLGRMGLLSASRATFLGMVSSSCSYAASAMARSLFARGASWTNSLVFMIASTNLVIELGIVLYLLLGWEFLVAEFLGGIIMIALLTFLLPRVFRDAEQSRLHEHVTAEVDHDADSISNEPAGVRNLLGWSRAARFAWGDLNMLKKELLLGFVVAGFLAADVPSSWWQTIFITGHGPWTVLENVIVAPLLAVISFVCSVGNIPLAAALWSGGVAFGGVIAFIFADLITIPLLLIYRRFFGKRATLKIFLTFWLTMSTAGLAVELIFRTTNQIPVTNDTMFAMGEFDLGWTLILNIVAVAVVAVGAWLIRQGGVDVATAIDPVCGMQVQRATAPAVIDHDGVRYYFCAPRCADRFRTEPSKFLSGNASTTMREDPDGDALDPVCGMKVNSKDPAAVATVDGKDVYFCGEGCRDSYVRNPLGAGSQTQPIKLARKPTNE